MNACTKASQPGKPSRARSDSNGVGAILSLLSLVAFGILGHTLVRHLAAERRLEPVSALRVSQEISALQTAQGKAVLVACQKAALGTSHHLDHAQDLVCWEQAYRFDTELLRKQKLQSLWQASGQPPGPALEPSQER
jgi:hypothetical protein